MDTWKMVKAAMPGPPCWETDWEILSSCGLTGFFGEMERTMQNPRWHGEKDVMTHTRMVCDALAGLEEFRSLSEKVRHEVFLAALLHDIGKIPCTRLEDGQWTSPNHGRVGSRMAREFLWREWGMAGEADLQALRECVCLLIRFHMVPGHILRRKDGERTLIQISAWGEAAPDFSLKLLHLLAEADLRGRICEDTEEKLLQRRPGGISFEEGRTGRARSFMTMPGERWWFSADFPEQGRIPGLAGICRGFLAFPWTRSERSRRFRQRIHRDR